jgi:hypothetical protein
MKALILNKSERYASSFSEQDKQKAGDPFDLQGLQNSLLKNEFIDIVRYFKTRYQK